ncbi:pyridoxamine 5'-phosphate oxidase family protein [Anaerosphaera multitolerans]|uniref:Pyridoxamine 5'-phosphate oxidase family protein n=1 Tax=Anaerosphaera multitolerans TaxID=2487351 RepID=A0A437S854_9FIRM|nr:pyridoxamine 5'-phosphate oxidase family protein [Anaerosphaera multitolerans]RVU55007.1 pyridoxamine 5'-phosphate oxidase family protein [Anaerosphaera multitolerans]
MFREMRRKKQILPLEISENILKRRTAGVLALSGDNNYPYALPISYVYYDNKIYFHCAKTGHKIDAIEKNDRVSFCVIDKDRIVAEEFTTYFRSVIVFGKAHILENAEEKRRALKLLAEKYSPEFMESSEVEIKREFNLVTVVEISIEHISGKEAIELVNK